MAMRLAIYILLMCCCTLEATVLSSTAICVKPRGKICSINVLNEDTSRPTSLLPDLTDRVELHVVSGQVKALTETNTRSSNMEKLRILRLEGLGLESVFVRGHFEELHLRGNRIVNLTITGSDTYSLKVLDMRKNQFANVTQLQPFERMVELKLDDNQITVLALEPFSRMTQLRLLSLAGNRIKQIVPSLKPFELGELEYFSLARNELVSFGTANWQLPSLKELLLNNNRLVELPDIIDFEQFFSLEQLALGENDWSCSWLDRALGSVLKPDSETSIKLDVGPNTECASEKVAGICCKFTISSSNVDAPTTASGELFVQEIRQARQQSEKLTAVHDEFVRSWNERLKVLHTKLQNMLVGLMAELQVNKPVTVLQVKQLSEDLEDLKKQLISLEKDEHMRDQLEKRLGHFMIEMKNKLLNQTIETDKLLAQVSELRYSFDKQIMERN
ncbi:leucine-rich repeat-containing protein 53-like [Anopheles darlingi]|uniref:leucine-rich repeat-containing protein 53-like n=1 Tax=Anopheles darlingi TaxID=43151 RepID=UPI00210005A9|nr:leucine-rich repeat-containing protein 53-like [Anopheles darlingi]